MSSTSTIAYDEPIENLIAGLNNTGHITHGNFTKTMVTFHHNGGIHTAQEVLDIWKTREASAHFDVDRYGKVAQYADVHDYAWACANTYGNETSISIEMSNSTLGPQWLVDPSTWDKGARLAAWLFVHVIHAAPSRSNVVFHHHWYATACAGPYMDSVYDELVARVQHYYALFTQPSSHPTPAPTTSLPTISYGSKGAYVKDLQAFMLRVFPSYAGPIANSGGTDGIFGAGTQRVVKEFQSRDRLTVDGIVGPHTWAALEHFGFRA